MKGSIRVTGLRMALFAPLLLTGPIHCGGSQADPGAASDQVAEGPLEIRATQVREMAVDRQVQVVGTLFAKEQVSLTSKMSGTVREVLVDFGSPVRRGQLLIALDPEEAQIAVSRAEAALAEGLAEIGLSPDGDENTVRVDETPGVAEANSMLADARTKLESASRLVETRDIPEQRFLELQKTAEMRQAALRRAEDQVRAQVAMVKTRRAELALAKKRLADTRLYAPFDGSVVERHVSPGEFVRDDGPLVTVAQTNPLRLRARIPETGVAGAKVGGSLTFQTDAYPNRDFSAKVTDISPVLDPASRTLVGEAMVDNSKGLLKPGMFAKVFLVAAKDVKTVMVPKSAVLYFGGLTKLFVIGADGSVQERVIQTGQEKDDWVEVLDGGARPGETVATELLDQLASGVKVRVS